MIESESAPVVIEEADRSLGLLFVYAAPECQAPFFLIGN